MIFLREAPGVDLDGAVATTRRRPGTAHGNPVPLAFVRRSILIVSASMGAGHDGAAKELRSASRRAGHRVEVIDFLDAVAFHIGPLLRWFYQVQLRLFPWSYELSYRMSPMLRAPAVIVDTWLTRRKLKRAIKEFRPDTIVSVYPLASLVLGRMRRKKTLRVPVVTYLTDFAVHSLWVHPGIDRHLAVSELSAQAATARGGKTPGARGPLVSDRFRDGRRRPGGGASSARPRCPRTRGARRRGLVGRRRRHRDRRRDRASGEFHPITVCGRDEKLRAELEARGFGTVIGWTDDMPSLMTAADALVENAGGLTCMEAFAVGLPVVTYLPIAGHGKDNAEMMSRAGVNVYAHDEVESHRPPRGHRAWPGRDGLVAQGQRLFTGDPAVGGGRRSRRRTRRSTARAAWCRCARPRRARRAWIAAATLLVLYTGLTLGRAGRVGDRRGRRPSAGGRPPHRVRRRAPRRRAARGQTLIERHEATRRHGRRRHAHRARPLGPARGAGGGRRRRSPTGDGATAPSCAGRVLATTSTARAT